MSAFWRVCAIRRSEENVSISMDQEAIEEGGRLNIWKRAPAERGSRDSLFETATKAQTYGAPIRCEGRNNA
jgi:hypothetical protein